MNYVPIDPRGKMAPSTLPCSMAIPTTADPCACTPFPHVSEGLAIDSATKELSARAPHEMETSNSAIAHTPSMCDPVAAIPLIDGGVDVQVSPSHSGRSLSFTAPTKLHGPAHSCPEQGERYAMYR